MDIPVKIDGGGSFYTYDTAKVVPGNEILVISNLRVAIIKVASKSDFIYLHPQNLNRKRPTGGIDTSTFIGNGYMIKLNTRKVKSINNHEDLYSGTLTIKYKQRSFVIKIHGIEDFLH